MSEIRSSSLALPKTPSLELPAGVAAKAFRSDINALRALSIVLVLLFHFKIPPFGGGFIGVDVFFVISGFLMTQIIMKGRFDTRAVLDFFKARLTRIYPALAVLICVSCAVAPFLVDPLQQAMIFKEGLYAATFLSNIHYLLAINYFAPQSDTHWFLHTWSLSVEWQFYILYPIALAVAHRLFGVRFLPLVIVAIFVISLLLCLFYPTSSASHPFYLLPFRAWEMVAGGIAFVLPRPRPRPWVAAAAYGVIIACACVLDSSRAWPSAATLVPVAAATLILTLRVSVDGHALYRIVHPIGLYSYSIYLWHWVVLVYLRYRIGDPTPEWILAGLVLSAVLGAVSYHLVERRGQAFLRHYRLRTSVVAAVVVVALVAATAPLQRRVLAAAPQLDGVPSEVWQSYMAAPADGPDPDHCTGFTKGGELRSCVFEGKANPGVKSLLLGDSHALMWVPRLERLAGSPASDGIRSITLASHPGCPIIPHTNNGGQRCDLYNDLAFRAAMDGGYDSVVISSLWHYFNGAYDLCRTGPNGCVRTDPTEAFKAGFAEFADRVRALAAKGIKVTIPLPGAYSRYDLPPELARRQFLGLGIDSIARVSRDGEDAKRRMVRDALSSLSKIPGVSLPDSFDMLCDAQTCSFVDERGRLLLRDPNHLRASIAVDIPFLDPAFKRPVVSKADGAGASGL